MQNLTLSEELITKDVDQAKIEFEGITSFRKRLKVLKKWRPKGVLGLDSAYLKKSFLKRTTKNPLSEPIKIKRDCILDLVILTQKPKKSIERGLATFFKKYYLLQNISNYSREWLVFGPEGYRLDPRLISGTVNLKKKKCGQSEKRHKRKKKQHIKNHKKIKQTNYYDKNQKQDQIQYKNQITTKFRINKKHKNKNKTKKNQNTKQKQRGYLKYKYNSQRTVKLKKKIKFKTVKKYQIKKKKSRSFKKCENVKAVKLSKSQSTNKLCSSKLEKQEFFIDSMKNFDEFDLMNDHSCKNIGSNENANFEEDEGIEKENRNKIVENKKYACESEDIEKNSQKKIYPSSTPPTNPRKRLYNREFTTLVKSASLNNLQTSGNNKNVMGENKKIKPNNFKYEEYYDELLMSPQETPVSSPQSTFSFSISSDNESEIFSDFENDSELDQLNRLPYFQLSEQNDEPITKKEEKKSGQRKKSKVRYLETRQDFDNEQENEKAIFENAPEVSVEKYFYNNELNENFIAEDNHEIMFEQNDSFWDEADNEEMGIPIFDWFESTNPLIITKNDKLQKNYHPHLDFDLIGGIN
ncbi:hypothetical protein M0813_30181 [Anaeramoeba flamelloides]|uniref:Uncharacterized protein n=1 Tax=Anaeramoeba flamelloides TaxID=1746091 RepID=A0ABQ8XKR7_9EUKA|nr:hypothetical protein M0813_30181 [Anaeramoeba flamelloides]